MISTMMGDERVALTVLESSLVFSMLSCCGLSLSAAPSGPDGVFASFRTSLVVGKLGISPTSIRVIVGCLSVATLTHSNARTKRVAVAWRHRQYGCRPCVQSIFGFLKCHPMDATKAAHRSAPGAVRATRRSEVRHSIVPALIRPASLQLEAVHGVTSNGMPRADPTTIHRTSDGGACSSSASSSKRQQLPKT